MGSDTVQVSTFKDEYLPDFVRLNSEWIEHYFRLEKTDLHQLNHPKENILDIGGEIFFILEAGKVVGTCAMVPHGNDFELAKMAVSPAVRGKGYGDVLMDVAIHWARQKKLPQIILLSNTILEPAINLYKKHGFKTVHLGKHPDYERCNIEMSLTLD